VPDITTDLEQSAVEARSSRGAIPKKKDHLNCPVHVITLVASKK